MSDSLFRDFSILCRNLAPVASPFLSATGELCSAIHTSQVEAAQAQALAKRLKEATASTPDFKNLEEASAYFTEAED